MIFTILTLFPRIFESPLNESLIKKAREKGLLEFNIVNIRDFATDIHQDLRRRPFRRRCGHGDEGGAHPPCHGASGGERGEAAVRASHTPRPDLRSGDGRRGSPACPTWPSCAAGTKGWTRGSCRLVDDEVSIGDYMLSGGEAAALVVIDAVSRLVPGVLGNEASPDRRELHGRAARIPAVYAAAGVHGDGGARGAPLGKP